VTVQIQFRRGTAAQWTSVNPLLSEGEMGLELDTGKFKVGNGSTYWNSLPYSSGTTGATGPQGATGSQGATGATGVQGPSGAISVSSPIVNSGTSTSASLSFNGSVASVAYATNSGSSTYSSSAGAAPIPASVSYSASSGLASNSTNFAGQAQSYYAPISSPNLTGTPLAPTAASATNTTQIATTAFVRGEITNLVNSAPTTLDTLNELAAALGNDPNFATTTASTIGLKAPIANPTFTGTVNLGSNVATGSVSSALNSASLAGQPGSYYYPASSITAASVAYSTNAGNATTLGGQSSAYYYPSASITTASVAYSTNAGNSASTSQTNFNALTISGSSVATQNYVNNKFFYETIPFTVTGSVSTARAWDYRFYNDTGGTRSINGVRASLGSAPSGSAMNIDIRKNGITGANSIFTASGFSILSGSITSGLISSGFNSGSSVASGDYLTVAVTQVGSASAGSDLVVQVMWS